MGIKLVALDMDGTTLRSDVTLADITRQTIEAAADHGIIVVPTTGRCFNSLPKEIRQIDSIRYAITSNGAQVTDIKQRKSLYKNPLTSQEVSQIIALTGAFDVMVEAYIDGRIILKKECLDHLERYNIPKQYWDFYRQTCIAVSGKNGFASYLKDGDIEKFNICFHRLEERPVLAGLLEAKTKTTVTQAAENNLEVTNATANKADGLRQLAEYLGISQQEIMAIGDSNNDYAMLKYAGISVAMGNAADRIRQISDYVTKSNDQDGVAWAIKKLIFHEQEAAS